MKSWKNCWRAKYFANSNRFVCWRVKFKKKERAWRQKLVHKRPIVSAPFLSLTSTQFCQVPISLAAIAFSPGKGQKSGQGEFHLIDGKVCPRRCPRVTRVEPLPSFNCKLCWSRESGRREAHYCRCRFWCRARNFQVASAVEEHKKRKGKVTWAINVHIQCSWMSTPLRMPQHERFSHDLKSPTAQNTWHFCLSSSIFLHTLYLLQWPQRNAAAAALDSPLKNACEFCITKWERKAMRSSKRVKLTLAGFLLVRRWWRRARLAAWGLLWRWKCTGETASGCSDPERWAPRMCHFGVRQGGSRRSGRTLQAKIDF